MKKLFLVFLMFFATANSFVWSYDVDLMREGQYQKKVMETGFGILNANSIDKRVIFRFERNKQVNSFASSDKSVVVLSGLFPYFDDDSELAAVLSHEIAHCVDYYGGFFRMVAMGWAPKKYEEKADKKAVDYMVKAGYDPVALIVVLNKFGTQPNWDFGASHPKTSKRLAYVYDYIYQKYPAYLADNQYKTNLYYQNFLLTSKKEREKIRANNQKLIDISNKKQKKDN